MHFSLGRVAYVSSSTCAKRGIGNRATLLEQASLPRGHPQQRLALDLWGHPGGLRVRHLLPELAEGQETIAEAVGEGEGLALLESTSACGAAPLEPSEANLGR